MSTLDPDVLTVKAPPFELHLMEPKINVPETILKKAQNWMDWYYSFLTERTHAYVLRMAAEAEKVQAGGVKPESGGPVTHLGYQYWNVLSAGPIQFPSDPPWRPSKIIAAGEIALLLGVVWINPAADPGGGIPGTVALGARNYRVRFESINKTSVLDGPDATYSGTFPDTPATINFYAWFFSPPDPGVNPRWMQSMFTADVTTGAQPFAAFATWHFDPSSEPSFLLPPSVPAHWQFERPAEYLIYHK